MSSQFSSWIAGATAQALSALRAIRKVPPTTQSGTTYTLALTDAGGMVRCSNASAVTVTVPTNAVVAFPTGTVVTLLQSGAGQVSIAGSVGVTIRKPSTKNAAIAEQYGVATLIKLDSDEWLLGGYLESP